MLKFFLAAVIPFALLACSDKASPDPAAKDAGAATAAKPAASGGTAASAAPAKSGGW
jgi:hypothetical protein